MIDPNITAINDINATFLSDMGVNTNDISSIAGTIHTDINNMKTKVEDVET